MSFNPPRRSLLILCVISCVALAALRDYHYVSRSLLVACIGYCSALFIAADAEYISWLRGTIPALVNAHLKQIIVVSWVIATIGIFIYVPVTVSGYQGHDYATGWSYSYGSHDWIWNAIDTPYSTASTAAPDEVEPVRGDKVDTEWKRVSVDWLTIALHFLLASFVAATVVMVLSVSYARGRP